jgi:hypothetical protein
VNPTIKFPVISHHHGYQRLKYPVITYSLGSQFFFLICFLKQKQTNMFGFGKTLCCAFLFLNSNSWTQRPLVVFVHLYFYLFIYFKASRIENLVCITFVDIHQVSKIENWSIHKW